MDKKARKQLKEVKKRLLALEAAVTPHVLTDEQHEQAKNDMPEKVAPISQPSTVTPRERKF